MKQLPSGSLDLSKIRREQYRRDPCRWVDDVLGEFIWSKQREIMESVRDNRRTTVQSCHEAGKSFISSRIVSWWLETHEPGEAFVVTSAPTAPQVRAILWREIGRAHSRGKLAGRVNQTEWWLPVASGKEEIVAFGRKPADTDPTAFQGIHAKYVLVVFDEAVGIPRELWDAADSLIANDLSRFLAIGNPDDPLSEFAAVCKPGSGWNTIKISAFDTPNLTGEPVPESLRHLLIGKTWIEEKQKKWGETNPLYRAKVLGEFPEVTDGGLIQPSWVSAAQLRTLEPREPVELGMDVGAGGDKSVVCLRRGPVARIIWDDQNPDTMQTCGRLIATLRETGAATAKVDPLGVGKGVADRAAELGAPVYGVNVGEAAEDREAFENLRAELYWNLRERFQDGDIDIDPNDDDLAAELLSLRFERSSRGRLKIESKIDMRKRGLSSPDRADALMLAFAKGYAGPTGSLFL